MRTQEENHLKSAPSTHGARKLAERRVKEGREQNCQVARQKYKWEDLYIHWHWHSFAFSREKDGGKSLDQLRFDAAKTLVRPTITVLMISDLCVIFHQLLADECGWVEIIQSWKNADTLCSTPSIEECRMLFLDEYFMKTRCDSWSNVTAIRKSEECKENNDKVLGKWAKNHFVKFYHTMEKWCNFSNRCCNGYTLLLWPKLFYCSIDRSLVVLLGSKLKKSFIVFLLVFTIRVEASFPALQRKRRSYFWKSDCHSPSWLV
jgi:hypothetical protein